jgi:LuxR family maltose regulon positive regulatory protein
MSALPVETLTEDDVVILLAPIVLEALMRTVTHLPPGTPLVLHARSTADALVVEATSVLRAVPTALVGRSCGSVSLVQSLSAAERRVLQYLRTHLTLAEIASRLYVSRNTVKSQAISIYRKLGVSCRSDAVQVAVDADLAGAQVRTLHHS